MNLLDTAIIVIVGTTFVMSLFRGVIKEIFSLGSVILGFLIANRTYDNMGEFLMGFVGHAPVAKILGYALVFIGSTIAIRLTGTFIEKGIKKVMLGWANHTIGSLFGFMKGCLIISVIVMIMTSFMPNSKILQESKLTPYVISSVGLLAKISPPEIKKRFAETREKLEEIWKEKKLASYIQEKSEMLMGKFIMEDLQ